MRDELRSSLVKIGLFIVLPLAGLGLFAPWIAPYDPLELLDPVVGGHRSPGTVLAAVRLTSGKWQLAERVRRVGADLEVERLGGSYVLAASDVANLTASGVADRRIFVLGTDRFGRDVLSRIIYGARVSLQIAFLSMSLAIAIGIGVGALAATGPKLLDACLMRLVDGLIAFPMIILLILLSDLFVAGPWALILLLGCTSWMMTARIMRGELLSLGSRDFVTAARGLGASPWRIFFRHLLPNALTPVMVQAALMVGNLVLFESSLSFLGWGIEKPYATWGNMINESRVHLAVAWWTAVFPGLALVISVIVLNVATDRIRDLLDPRWNQEGRR